MTTTDQLREFRRHKDQFLRGHPDSPLPPTERREFAGLSYFEPDPALRYRVPVQPADGGELEIGTSDGRTRRYFRAGKVTVTVAGEEVTLTLLAIPGHPGFFLPFRDGTSGLESYGAGRYLDVGGDEDGTVVIDFNLAYNPYCAYSEAYSCPLPPPENWLRAPVRAGEMAYRSADR